MTTPAVTESASAAEEVVSTGFLPEDENYRLTGKFTEEPKKEEPKTLEPDTQPSQVEDSAPPGAVKAADSATAPPQKKKAGADVRKDQLNTEIRELIRKRDELAASLAPSVKQDSQPAEKSAKPKIDDVDKTGKPKFKTYDDYLDARDAWLRGETLREFSETTAKTQREQQTAQAQQVITQGWQSKVSEARKAHADFDEVALRPDLPLKQGTVPDVFILDSPHGTEILYHLGQNPAELDRINALNPLAQARELFMLEQKFVTPKKESSSAPPVTKAPPPPHQVSGKGTVAKDAVEQAIEDGDSETYIKTQNAKDLARLKRK